VATTRIAAGGRLGVVATAEPQWLLSGWQARAVGYLPLEERFLQHPYIAITSNARSPGEETNQVTRIESTLCRTDPLT
jgi:hypothetical protein